MSADKERIAELEARNKRIEDCLVHERTRVADLILTNEELTRKLAEQQAAICKVLEVRIGGEPEFKLYNTNPDIWGVYLERVLGNIDTKELNTLLAKAKEEGFAAGSLNAGFAHALDCNIAFNSGREAGIKEAVPEGWQVVPKTLAPEMMKALADETEYRVDKALWKPAYKAMLQSAPKPQGT